MLAGILALPLRGGMAGYRIDQSDPEFATMVENELDRLRRGDRGLACQQLARRFDMASATTTITPLTREESTWHPNDRKGFRSHVVPQDVKVRGAARPDPTQAVFYLHPNHINPKISSYKLGTFVHVLSEATDLNEGAFPGSRRIREKRASFYRNAWRDSQGYPLLNMSGGGATTEYQEARKLGLVLEENSDKFPILFPSHYVQFDRSEWIDIPEDRSAPLFDPAETGPKMLHGQIEERTIFIKIYHVGDKNVFLTFGYSKGETFRIFKRKLDRKRDPVKIPSTDEGVDYSELEEDAEMIVSGSLDPQSRRYSEAWFEETGMEASQ